MFLKSTKKFLAGAFFIVISGASYGSEQPIFGEWPTRQDKLPSAIKEKEQVVRYTKIPLGQDHAIKKAILDQFISYCELEGIYLDINAVDGAVITGKGLLVIGAEKHPAYVLGKSEEYSFVGTYGELSESEKIALAMLKRNIQFFYNINDIYTRDALAKTYFEFASSVLHSSKSGTNEEFGKYLIKNLKSSSQGELNLPNTLTLKYLVDTMGSSENSTKARKRLGELGLINAVDTAFFSLANIGGSIDDSNLAKSLFVDRAINRSITSSMNSHSGAKPAYLIDKEVGTGYEAKFKRKMANIFEALYLTSSAYRDAFASPGGYKAGIVITQQDSVYFNTLSMASSTVQSLVSTRIQPTPFYDAFKFDSDQNTVYDIGDYTKKIDIILSYPRINTIDRFFSNDFNPITDSLLDFAKDCTREIVDRDTRTNQKSFKGSASLNPAAGINAEFSNIDESKKEKEQKIIVDSNCFYSDDTPADFDTYPKYTSQSNLIENAKHLTTKTVVVKTDATKYFLDWYSQNVGKTTSQVGNDLVRKKSDAAKRLRNMFDEDFPNIM